MDSYSHKSFLLFLIPVGIAVAAIVLTDSTRRIHSSKFINSDISFPYLSSIQNLDEDEFITQSWDWVYKNIAYERFGSGVDVIGEYVTCSECYVPDEVMKKGASNCIGKSILLTSMLRTKIEPDRVYLALGNIETAREKSGHAWVTVRRGNSWYILDPTQPPGFSLPNGVQYVAKSYLNDLRGMTADDNMRIQM